MKQAGLALELLETRHVRNAFKLMPVKTDRKDARGIAQLIRMGWFRPVHCKSVAAQETRSLLQSKLHDIELGLRGTLRGSAWQDDTEDLREPGSHLGGRPSDATCGGRCTVLSAL